MTQTEALRLAHEELKHIKAWCLRRTGIGLVDENVLAKVEEALANHIEDNLTMVTQPEHDPYDEVFIAYGFPKPKQEPVAEYIGENWDGSIVQLYEDLQKGTKLYTAPPQRTWVGLTLDELIEISKPFEGLLPEGWMKLTSAVEAKLKEKNT